MLDLVGWPWGTARWRQLEWSSWSIWLATAAAVVFSITQPVTRIYSIAADPYETGQAVYAVVAFALYLPIQVWLILSISRGDRGWPQWIGLGAMAAVIFAAMPSIGVGWVGIIQVLGALTLLMLRPPFIYVAFGGFLIAPTVLTSALGRPDWALYFTMGVLVWCLPLAAGIWLINLARQLRAAQLELAAQAVLRERLRIDQELTRTVGTGLDSIALEGDRAAGLAVEDPEAAARELKRLVKDARSTLAEARTSVRRYREISPRAELETALTLLEAAGIAVNLELPAGGPPRQASEEERAALRREITRLLIDGDLARVTIAVETVDGRIKYRVKPDAERRSLSVETA